MSSGTVQHTHTDAHTYTQRLAPRNTYTEQMPISKLQYTQRCTGIYVHTPTHTYNTQKIRPRSLRAKPCLGESLCTQEQIFANKSILQAENCFKFVCERRIFAYRSQTLQSVMKFSALMNYFQTFFTVNFVALPTHKSRFTQTTVGTHGRRGELNSVNSRVNFWETVRAKQIAAVATVNSG